jgi:hypothetical protein
MVVCAPNDRLLQSLRVHVPGATDPLIELELFNVMDEFFRRTSAWRHVSDIDLVENVLEYGFVVPADTTVVRLMGVTHQNIPVVPTSAVGVAQTSIGQLEPSMVFPDGDVVVDPHHSDLQGGLFTYAVYRPEYISVTSLPDAEARKYPLQVTLALSLARSCLECECGDWALEEWMWDTFFQDFLDGSLARLYAMPAKPWSNKDLTVYHGKRFRNAMAYRKQESMRGYSFAVPAWRFPRWNA